MKYFSGIVVSKNNLKTVAVNVTRYISHPKYKKIVKNNKVFHAHYEDVNIELGDIVRIKSSRPFSSSKRFLVFDVMTKGRK